MLLVALLFCFLPVVFAENAYLIYLIDKKKFPVINGAATTEDRANAK